MKSIEEIRRQLSSGKFDLTRHALKRIVERNISEAEIRQAGLRAVIIEDYPDDKYAPSCLLFGSSDAGRPLHIQVSRMESELTRIITVYEPDPEEWIDFVRRKSHE